MRVLLLLLFICTVPCQAYLVQEADYKLKRSEPIDVIIPCAEKDVLTLGLCIKAIKKYGKDVRRVIVISEKQLTDEAEWFDEKKFAFTRLDLARAIFDTPDPALHFAENWPEYMNWIYQKFLRLYAAFTIPKLSQNILLLSADTIFLRKVNFLRKEKYGIFTSASGYHLQYFEHMNRLFPWLKRVHSQHSGCAHHILVQKPVLEDLLDTIEKEHKSLAWKAMCRAIDITELFNHPLSEYEIYFNFALMRSPKFTIQNLKWKNISTLAELESARAEGHAFVTCHK